jgi:transglutaminase superfamily protein
VSDYYGLHGELTDPGRFARDLAHLPHDLSDLCAFIQGVVIHADWASAYGVTRELSRQTLPVADRLALVEAAGGRDLPPDRRTPGTCRDFALMMCTALRERGLPARVRCGFATYFQANPFEDHWVCEYWRQDRGCWAQADAQLDAVQREQLNVGFDPTDLPAGVFINAGEAWTSWRAGKIDAESFGHGEARGAWLLRVNLMRDLLSLQKQETSGWDAWRTIPVASRLLDEAAIASGDRIAAATSRAGHVSPRVEAPPFGSVVA